jgi:hypothetical protein
MIVLPSSAFKRVSQYRPHFDTVTGGYSIQAGYAFDFSDSPQYRDISLSGTGPRFDEGYTFDSGVQFGTPSVVYPTDTINIPGNWRRLQIRYKHYAAREPVTFAGHNMTIQMQRSI